MDKNSIKYNTYIKILNKELVKAMGCTEPIAIALCAAVARKTLACIPDRVDISVSGNIIKNAKSVIVPNTNGLKGIKAAALVGIIGGIPEKMLEVISEVTNEQKEELLLYMDKCKVNIEPMDTLHTLDIEVTVKNGENVASAHIRDEHTNIIEVVKNGKKVYEGCNKSNVKSTGEVLDYSLLTMEDICDFADSVIIEDVDSLIRDQIETNSNIAREGLDGNYGASIGKVLISSYGEDIKVRAKAMAAAGSDARMNGSEMPVVINSGSGNQGMTVSLPVIEYAREYNIEEDRLIRALLVSNLSAIHLKTAIGRLSAYCGAVSAGASAGAGIAYLLGGGFREVAHTIVNALAITSGIVCDGAKASCAAKIASAVDAGILGYEMFKKGKQFYGGDGIVSKGVENTIRNIGLLGQEGMYETDKEIIHIMTCID